MWLIFDALQGHSYRYVWSVDCILNWMCLDNTSLSRSAKEMIFFFFVVDHSKWKISTFKIKSYIKQHTNICNYLECIVYNENWFNLEWMSILHEFRAKRQNHVQITSTNSENDDWRIHQWQIIRTRI